MSTKHHLVFAPIGGADRGAEVADRLRQAIALGLLPDGTQLPSEAELATQFGVSTGTLRAGLEQLRQSGLLSTRRGRGGGNFVHANDRLTHNPQCALRGLELEDLRDLRDYHVATSGAIAALAADRSGTISAKRLATLGDAVRDATKPAALVRTESRFHIELAAATRSVRLTRAELATQAEIGALLWIPDAEARTPDETADDHAGIVAAIAAGRRDAAREAAERHAATGLNHLIELRMHAGK